MKPVVAAFAAGLIFGLGLVVSDMINPARVLAFLDLAGTWDPSLLFVLAGAVTVSFIGTQVVERGRTAPLLASRFHWPSAKVIDVRLIGGAAVFGVGWGLVGLCPGPALAALSLRPRDVGIFVLAMLAGLLLHQWIESRRAAPPPGLEPA
jgi:uncharacterized membrane protein YedE/YeeE